MAPVHYFICDKNENCAVAESLDHALTVTAMPKGTLQFLSNDTAKTTLSRDDITEKWKLWNQQPGLSVAMTFKALDDVWVPNWSRWQIVYDLTASTIYWRTEKNSQIKSINFSQLDFSCRSPVMAADVNTANSDLKPIRLDLEENIMKRLLSFFVPELGAQEKALIAASLNYPAQQTRCVEAQP